MLKRLLSPVLALLLAPLLSTPAQAVATGPEEEALLSGLKLQIQEEGPDRPWLVVVTNGTEATVNAVKDPRLLSLQVQVPGKKKPVDCKLPEAMLPTRAELERLRALAPGEAFRFRIDPRFYCFDGGESGVLVPGSMVEARYGFSPATLSSTRGGRKVVERLPSTPPYVAQFLAENEANEPDPPGPPAADGDDASSEADSADQTKAQGKASKTAPSPGIDYDEPSDDGSASPAEPAPADPVPHDADAPGLRQLTPIKLALGSAYSAWNTPTIEAEELTGGLRLEVVKGSDSLTARGAEVTIRVSNRGSKRQALFLRRELISYYLLGPDGLSVCSADEDDRAPDGQGFTNLGPGQEVTLVTRLVEFCPGELIDRPGFYLVGAELDAKTDGEESGVDAFTGVLFTTRGKPVRVQKGELPFVHRDMPPFSIRFTHGGVRRDTGAAADGAPTADTDAAASEP